MADRCPSYIIHSFYPFLHVRLFQGTLIGLHIRDVLSVLAVKNVLQTKDTHPLQQSTSLLGVALPVSNVSGVRVSEQNITAILGSDTQRLAIVKGNSHQCLHRG